MVTPTLSVADALIVTLPETVPPVGAVMLTVGGVISLGEPEHAVLE